MNDENIKISVKKSMDEIDLPPILYKYRDWAKEEHKKVLTHNELFLAPPASFEDEFDCKNLIRYDLSTAKEVYEESLKCSKEINLNFNRHQHKKFAKDCQKKGSMKNKKQLTDYLNKAFFKKFNEGFGILSLTAIADNLKMWNKYADSGKGFCVGLKTTPLCKDFKNGVGGGEIMYYDKLPIIKETDSWEKKISLLIYSKLNKWKFEKEYRLDKSNIQNRVATIPTDIFAEIILGAEMSKESKNEIISISKERFPKTQVFQAEIKNDSIIINKI